MPRRIQRRRTKGWRIPEGAVYVGRPSRWGNPHPWQEYRENAPRNVLWTPEERDRWCRERAVEAYREDVLDGALGDLTPLRGRDLVCWCPLDQPCHADVLIELANREPD